MVNGNNKVQSANLRPIALLRVNRILIYLLLMVFNFNNALADKIYLKNKEEINCTILNETDEDITIDDGGVNHSILKSKIDRIEYTNQQTPISSFPSGVNLNPMTEEQKILKEVDSELEKNRRANAKFILRKALKANPSFRNVLLKMQELCKEDKETKVYIILLGDIILESPEKFNNDLKQHLIKTCFDYDFNETGNIEEYESKIRFGTALNLLLGAQSLTQEQRNKKWKSVCERMLTDAKAGAVNKNDDSYELLSSIIILSSFKSEKEKFKELAENLFISGIDRIFDKSLKSPKEDWENYSTLLFSLLSSSLPSYNGKITISGENFKDINSKYEQLLNFYLKFYTICNYENEPKCKTYEEAKNFCLQNEVQKLQWLLSVIPEHHKELISSVRFSNGEQLNLDLFNLYNLNRLLKLNSNDQNTFTALEESVKGYLDDFDKKREEYFSQKNLINAISILETIAPEYWQKSTLTARKNSIRDKLNLEIKGYTDYSQTESQSTNLVSIQEFQNFLPLLDVKINTYKGTMYEKRFTELKMSIQQKYDELIKEEEEKRKAEEDLLKQEKENEIRVVVEGFLYWQPRYDGIKKYWDPTSKDAPQTIHQLQEHEIIGIIFEGLDKAVAKVYMEFTNEAGLNFKGTYSLKLVKRHNKWYVYNLSK